MARIIKDNTIPDTWKRVVSKSGKHKFIVKANGAFKNSNYDIVHCDDCTLNRSIYICNVKGNLARALAECEIIEGSFDDFTDVI